MLWPRVVLNSNELPRGRTTDGELTNLDPTIGGDGTRFDAWSFRAAAGEVAEISLTSSSFDAYLALAVGVASEQPLADLRILAEDDDGGGGRNARVRIRFPSSGVYQVLATSFDPQGRGSYQLRAEVVAPVTATVNSLEDWERRYPGGGDPAGRYAVVAGISDYSGIANSLEGPVEDARLFASLLIEELGFERENVIVLTDREVTRSHLIAAIRGHLGQAGPKGVAVFYYSGHGTQLESNVGLTGDLDPESDDVDEALYVWSDADSGTVVLDDELGLLATELRTENALIVLDACFSGTGTRGGAARAVKQMLFSAVRSTTAMPAVYLTSRAEAGQLARRRAGLGDVLAQPRRHILLAASAEDELSYTATGWPRFGGTISVFTYYLAESLEQLQPALNFVGLMEQVRARTLAYTLNTYQARQTPQLEGQQTRSGILDFLGKR